MVHEFIKSSEFDKVLQLNELLNNFNVSDSPFIKNPTQLINSKTGSNWDYCVCEAFKLSNEIGIPVKCYSLEIDGEFINFIVFNHDLFWYWFESYDKENKGIHEFHSWIRMINFIIHKYGFKKSNFKLGLRELNPLDSSIFGMNPDAYMNYVMSHPIIKITDTKIEDPTNYINENGIMRKFSDTNLNGVEYENNDSVETKLLADELPHRKSFNFTKCMKSLKTKGKTFSKTDKWNIFIKRFADSEMQKSMDQQIQRLIIKSRVANDPNEKKSYMDEANQLRREAIEKGYLSSTPKFYSDSNPKDEQNTKSTESSTATDNSPAKPTNIDHQDHSNGKTNSSNNTTNTNTDPPPKVIEDDTQTNDVDTSLRTKSDGSFQNQQLGRQQGGMIIPDAVKNNQSPSSQQQNQQNPSQPQQPQQKVTFGNMIKRMIPSMAIGFAGRSLGKMAGMAVW